MKKFRVIYNFNHSNLGFQNSITVTESDETKALSKAKEDVYIFYHANEREKKQFSFKYPIQLN